jgi:hypothetical protein
VSDHDRRRKQVREANRRMRARRDFVVTRNIIRVDSLEKVIEKLATTEKTTIAIAREVGGKVRVTSGSWEGEKVILKDQVLEVRNVDGRLHVSRKARSPTNGTRRSRPMIRMVRGPA